MMSGEEGLYAKFFCMPLLKVTQITYCPMVATGCQSTVSVYGTACSVVKISLNFVVYGYKFTCVCLLSSHVTECNR